MAVQVQPKGIDERVVKSWVSGVLGGKTPASVGIPTEVANVYRELVSRGLSPDEQATFQQMTASGGAKRLGGSGLLSAASGSEFVEQKRALENKLTGYMLAAVCTTSPKAAADGLCAIFEPVYKTESSGK